LVEGGPSMRNALGGHNDILAAPAPVVLVLERRQLRAAVKQYCFTRMDVVRKH
jgi:hypothetical protein